jgi:predicted transglutaminase-like protease
MSLQDIIRQYSVYRQFIPTKKDLDNFELKKLANRLKASSFNKTLINVLEWQDRNVKYWEERSITSGILSILIIIALISYSLIFGQANLYLYFVIVFISLITIIGNFTMGIIINLIIISMFIIVSPLPLILSSPSFVMSSNIFLFVILTSFILGAFISLISQLVLKYRSIKRFNPKFEINDTFKLSLSIEKILKYRLSICRDYAKLTCALLLKIYPKKELFFLLISKHVAVAVKSNNKIFVLDQKLPILTLDKWDGKWKRRLKKQNLNIHMIKINLDKDKVKIQSVKSSEISFISDNSEISYLVDNVRLLLNLKFEKIEEGISPSLKIPIKDISFLFSDDEIFKDSLIELIKNKIEDELVGNIDKIKNLDIELEKNDLILKIWL